MIKVQPVGYRDLPKVYNIELRSYEYPLEHASLQELMELRGSIPFIGLINGMGATWAHGMYYQASAEVEIKRLATHPDYRMQGFGRQVIGHIWNEAVKRDVRTLFFMVPEYQTEQHDPDSVSDFLWKMEFKATTVEKDYFHRYGRPYDAIRFERAT